MIRKLWPLAILAVLALIGAGCSNDAVEGGNTADTSAAGTNAAGTNVAGTNAAGTNAGDPEQGVKFAECMRNNGVSDFPDPNAKGEFVYGVSVTPAVFERAVDACKELQPPGTLSADRSPEQQSASLEFAQCVRENGVKDFPDPAPGEPLVNTYEIPSSDTPEGMTILNAAMEKCGDLVEEVMGSQ
jgi:hypothetical protein